MLTNSKCIEIAEKVWGWQKRTDWVGKHDIVYWHDGEFKRNKKEVEQEVNSWQGFGRTVERISKMEGVNWKHSMKMDYYAFLLYGSDKEQLWEATHLAALSALGESDSLEALK